MLNMIPFQDISKAQNIFAGELYDFMAPLEILKGNSLCHFMLNKHNFIKKNFEN